MNWERLVLGRRSDAFGSARWPLLAVGGVLIAFFSASYDDWTFAAIGVAAAVIGAVMTFRTVRR